MKTRSLISAFAILLFTVASANASAVYTDEAAFKGALASGYYLETFTGCSSAPSSFSSGGFAYTAASAGGLYCGDWVGNSGNQLYGASIQGTPLTFTLTSDNIGAIGGYFFVTDVNNNLINGTVTLEFSDGMVRDVVSSTDGVAFLGYISNRPLTSLVITGASDQDSYVTLDNFYVGEAGAAVPEPSTWALLLSGGLLVFKRLRGK